MTAYISGSFITLCLLPFIATVLIGAAIRFFCRHITNDRLVSAAAGVSIVWVTALVVGMPKFPPTSGETTLPIILLTGLLLGSLLDQFLPIFHKRARMFNTLLDIAFAIGVISWFRGKFDLWGVIIFVVWGILQFRTRGYAGKNTISAVTMILSSCGLALVAWNGNASRDLDLALGVVSATLGLSVWLSVDRHLLLGFGYLWGGFSAQILIALRMIESNSALAAPIAILGFIFFANTAAASLTDWKPALRKVSCLLMIGFVSLFPLTLAVVITVAVSQLGETG